MEQAVEIVSLRRRKGGKKEPYDICFATKGKEWKVFYDFFLSSPNLCLGISFSSWLCDVTLFFSYFFL